MGFLIGFVVLFVLFFVFYASLCDGTAEVFEEKQKKQQVKTAKLQAYHQSMCTLTDDEKKEIQDILKHYTLISMQSHDTFDMIRTTVDEWSVEAKALAAKKAVTYAMPYARSFAMATGYKVSTIEKLYYNYNLAHGSTCNHTAHYHGFKMPIYEYGIFEPKVVGYSNDTIWYQDGGHYRIRFFVLNEKSRIPDIPKVVSVQ